MGTVVSIDVRDPGPSHPAVAAGIEAVVAWLHEVDRRFSVYREDSEIGLDRGGWPSTKRTRTSRDALRAALDHRRETGGAFAREATSRRRPSIPRLREGLAVDEAADLLISGRRARLLRSTPAATTSLGASRSGRALRWGVRHPADPAGSRPLAIRGRAVPPPASTSAGPTSATRAAARFPGRSPASRSSGRSWRPPTPTRLRPSRWARRALPGWRGGPASGSWPSMRRGSPRGRTWCTG